MPFKPIDMEVHVMRNFRTIAIALAVGLALLVTAPCLADPEYPAPKAPNPDGGVGTVWIDLHGETGLDGVHYLVRDFSPVAGKADNVLASVAIGFVSSTRTTVNLYGSFQRSKFTNANYSDHPYDQGLDQITRLYSIGASFRIYLAVGNDEDDWRSR